MYFPPLHKFHPLFSKHDYTTILYHSIFVNSLVKEEEFRVDEINVNFWSRKVSFPVKRLAPLSSSIFWPETGIYIYIYIDGRELACLTLLTEAKISPPMRERKPLSLSRPTKYLGETKFSVIREETGPFDLPSVTVEHRERAKRLALPPIDPNNCTASRNFHNAMENGCLAFPVSPRNLPQISTPKYHR